MKNFLTTFVAARLARRGSIAAASCVIVLATTGAGWADVITGNPSTDTNWTQLSNTLHDGTYVDGAANYDATMYTTAITLDATSPLLSTLNGDDWSVGDTVVGVGGLFTTTTPTADGWSGSYSPAANGDLTYTGAGGTTNTRIVVKYGASAAPSAWKTSTVAPTSGNGVGSLAGGGIGSILLGTEPNYFGPSANDGVLVLPTDSPEEEISSGVVTINDDVGRIITDWNSGELVGFESFLDITLLNTELGSSATPPEVQLGNAFDLDLQQNTSNVTDAQAQLPSSVSTPEPATLGLLAMASIGLLGRRRRRD